MKLHTYPTIILGLSLGARADLFPNGDFSAGNDGSWEEVAGGGTYIYDYPATGGNPDEYGVIDHSSNDGGFGIWVANGGGILTLDSLGLTAGETYNFTQDMILINGSDIGGFKLDFFNGPDFASSTNDLRIPMIGNGSTWETYTYEITIPTGVDGVKAVPLWGIGSTVGFDNIGFDPTLPPPPPLPPTNPVVVNGTMVQWIANDDQKIYQAQFSQDESTWTNLGAPIFGDSVQEAFDPIGAPFYRVVVSDPVLGEILINGDFDTPNFGDATCAQSWNCVGSQAPTLIDTDSFGGSNSIRLAVQNDNAGAPQTSEIQQNIIDVGGFLTPGETYNFSFRAKQISSGVSYVQRFRVQWLAAGGAEVPGAVSFVDFSGGDGTWDEITQNGLVAPATAETALIQIFGATGAVPGEGAKGEVLIDELSLAPVSSTPDTFLTTTQVPGIGIQFPTQSGVSYRVEASGGLDGFAPLGAPFVGNGETAAIGGDEILSAKYYRVIRNAIIPE